MGHCILWYWVSTSILAAWVFYSVAVQDRALRPDWLESVVAGIVAGWFVIPILLLDKIARFLTK